MKKFVLVILLFSFASPSFASTHKDVYNVSCKELWRALKDTLRNSGKYGIIAIDNEEMTASYNIGGNLTGKRINSAVLNSIDNGNSCELQVQTAYTGLINNDAGDFKKRVEDSLAKLKGEPLPSDTKKADQAPPPPPPPPAASASLDIHSNPPSADIEIDGSFVGNTPSNVSVTPGKHQIILMKKGFAMWTRSINISGGTIQLNADLDPAPAN